VSRELPSARTRKEYKLHPLRCFEVFERHSPGGGRLIRILNTLCIYGQTGSTRTASIQAWLNHSKFFELAATINHFGWKRKRPSTVQKYESQN
jgi:hypothetical protein